jgi:hypothetical protein
MGKENKFWNKTTLITIIIIALMVSSTAGFIFGRDESETKKYNGFKFRSTNDGWIAIIQGNDVMFHFHPLEVEELDVSDSAIEKLDAAQAYLTFEIGSNLQYIDIIRFEFITAMENNFGTYIISGTLNETDAYDFPIIDCINATNEIPVIKFIFANETKVYDDGNCIIAQAQSELEFLAIADKIRYKLFGVM